MPKKIHKKLKRTKAFMGRKKYKSTHIKTKAYKEFPYHSICSCCKRPESLSKTIESFNSPRDEYEKALKNYLKSINVEYSKAIGRALRQIAKRLAELNNPSLQQVNDIVVFNLLNNWKGNFSDKIKPIISTNINKLYKLFRSDKSIFKGSDIDIPKSILSTTDIRTLDYMKDLDELYLGRFITDQDTRRRLTNFIRKQHIAGAFQANNLSAFREEFTEFMDLEDWKISRIISTTTNKLRSSAALNYIHQTEIDNFEIRGVNDRLQCAWCREMQGVQFSVERAMTKLNKVIQSDPEIVSADSPFLVSTIKNPLDIRGLSGDQLQDVGIDLPPFHPNCRDRIVAVI